MARLIYSAIASLDGYVEDEDGSFDWAAPDEEVHAFVNELERPIGTYLYGRRMYETMVYWETGGDDQPRRRAGLRGDLAGGRQGRVLPDAAGGRRARGPGSSATSTPRRSGAEGERGSVTSRSAARSSPARRSRPGWSTSATSSWRRSSSGAASAPCLPACMPISSCWTSAGSRAVSSSSAIGLRLPCRNGRARLASDAVQGHPGAASSRRAGAGCPG